jgi:amidohydrolase
MPGTDPISQAIHRKRDDLAALRRRLHAIPELGFKETQTASVIADRLRGAGLAVQTGVGKTGVVGVLDSGRPGPTLMVRADIDGLPVVEQTSLPFASTNGAMHACGHDGHITMAVGAAEVLAGMKPQLRGRVVFAFQPAEEVVSGALAMFSDGLLETTRPGRVIGVHLWNQLPAGRIGVNRGTVFASADAFRLTVTGRGGHGALPHLAVDPVVAAAQIVSTAQTVVSREVPPNEMGVVTFGQVHGGTASNVIADRVVIEGTIRAYRPEIRKLIFDAVPRVAAGVASGLRCEAKLEHLFGSPPVINNPEVAAWVGKIATAVAGENPVGEHDPVSVGDDMAEFLNRVPGCYFLLGAAKKGAEPHHNARFDFDEACLPIGTEVFVRAAADYLR